MQAPDHNVELPPLDKDTVESMLYLAEKDFKDGKISADRIADFRQLVSEFTKLKGWTNYKG